MTTTLTYEQIARATVTYRALGCSEATTTPDALDAFLAADIASGKIDHDVADGIRRRLLPEWGWVLDANGRVL